MTPEERIDRNIDLILRAAGSSFSNYTMELSKEKLRKVMRNIMRDESIAGSNNAYKVLKGEI
jgi:hypothetical protein